MKFEDLEHSVDSDAESARDTAIAVVLRAYLEEWGDENVTLLVPAAWEQIGLHKFLCSRVKLVFATEDTIIVAAFYNEKLQICHETGIHDLNLTQGLEMVFDRPDNLSIASRIHC